HRRQSPGDGADRLRDRLSHQPVLGELRVVLDSDLPGHRDLRRTDGLGYPADQADEPGGTGRYQRTTAGDHWRVEAVPGLHQLICARAAHFRQPRRVNHGLRRRLSSLEYRDSLMRHHLLAIRFGCNVALLVMLSACGLSDAQPTPPASAPTTQPPAGL